MLWAVTNRIAEAVREAKANYVLRVNLEQRQLYGDIEEWFSYADKVSFAGSGTSVPNRQQEPGAN
jgi:hypothetical protein